MRYKITKKVLMFCCLFIGICALYGGICMLIDPSGKLIAMDTILPYFKVLPFSKYLFKNYIFSGIALIIVNGITNIVALIFLIKNKKLGIILGTIFGITLMMWITIQFIIFPFNFMSTSYFIFGFIQAITGYMCYVFYCQEKFIVDEKMYKNIGTNKDIAVVYFSRMGYTKKVAFAISDKLGASVLEVTTREKTEGTLGFWWCGRFGMLKKDMPINFDEDLSKYKKVIICTPIWVFTMSSPIRAFCNMYSNKLKNVDYVFVHFMKSKFTRVADEMDKILKVKRTNFKSICARLGKIKGVVYEKQA